MPLFAVLAWQAVRPLRAMGGHLFAGINFGAHEFGHLFFAFFGEWMTIAGGSLMQLLVPIGAAALSTVKIVQQAVLIVYEGADHGLTQTHQDRFNADLLDFING